MRNARPNYERSGIRERRARCLDAVEVPSGDVSRSPGFCGGVCPVRIQSCCIIGTASSLAPPLSRTFDSSSKQKVRAYWAWVAVCVSWGTTYLATRVAIETIPPFAMAGTRHFVAGMILALILWARGVKPPPRESWTGHALLGFLMIGVGNGCLVWAQQFVPSGIAAVMVSVIPFWMIGVEALMPGGERIRFRQFMGLILGFGWHLASGELQSSHQRRLDDADDFRHHHASALVSWLVGRLRVCQAP